MEVSKYVNKKYVSEYLENEIKEISQRWAGFMINKIALEKVLTITAFPEEMEEHYRVVSEALENSKKRKGKKPDIFVNFSDNIIENYKKINEYKEKETALENANKGLKEFTEFLEVATNLKNEIDNYDK